MWTPRGAEAGAAVHEAVHTLHTFGLDAPEAPCEDEEEDTDHSLVLLAAPALQQRVTLRQLVESDDQHYIHHDIKDWFA